MIQKFVDRFMAAEAAIRSDFAAKEPESYTTIVKRVVQAIHDEDDYESPDPERIHVINDGDYQGTLLYVIGASGYQPSDYWYVKVGYGSCSGCDTLEAIQSDHRRYDDNGNRITNTPEAVDDYWTLALHVVQGITAMQDKGAYGEATA